MLFFKFLEGKRNWNSHLFGTNMQSHDRQWLIYMISLETLIILFISRPLDNYVIPWYTGHFVCTQYILKAYRHSTVEILISLLFSTCHRLEI